MTETAGERAIDGREGDGGGARDPSGRGAMTASLYARCRGCQLGSVWQEAGVCVESSSSRTGGLRAVTLTWEVSVRAWTSPRAARYRGWTL